MKKVLNQILSVQFLKYFIVGITGFVVDAASLNILYFGIVGGPGIKILNIIYSTKLASSIIGNTVSFALNRQWSFEKTKGSLKKQSGRMIIVFLINIIIAAIIYGIWYDLLVWQDFINLGDLIPTLATFITSGIQMLLNFFIYKYIIFKD